MIDDGGRIKETSIESMARTLYSLTYSYPSYNPHLSEGPRINIMFTNFSRFHDIPDDIMIPGLESINKYEKIDKFSELIQKFKKEIVNKIHKSLQNCQTHKVLEQKMEVILPADHFYAFKIF